MTPGRAAYLTLTNQWYRCRKCGCDRWTCLWRVGTVAGTHRVGWWCLDCAYFLLSDETCLKTCVWWLTASEARVGPCL